MKSSGKTLAERKAFVRNCKAAYDLAAVELGLNDNMSAAEKVKTIVLASSAIQGEICALYDEIKIVNFENIKSIINLQKADWLETVNLYNRKHNSRFGKSAIERSKDRIKERVFSQTFKNKFLEDIIAPEETTDVEAIKVASEEDLQTSLNEGTESTDFAEILKRSADLRNTINTVLYKKYNSYAKAAQYASDFAINYTDFKMMVDWEYYKHGGYPSESTPAKLWSIVSKFNLALRFSQEYGFEQMNELLAEFGLEVVAKNSPKVPASHNQWWERHHFEHFNGVAEELPEAATEVDEQPVDGEAETTPMAEVDEASIPVATVKPAVESTIEIEMFNQTTSNTTETITLVDPAEVEEEEEFEDD